MHNKKKSYVTNNFKTIANAILYKNNNYKTILNQCNKYDFIVRDINGYNCINYSKMYNNIKLIKYIKKIIDSIEIYELKYDNILCHIVVRDNLYFANEYTLRNKRLPYTYKLTTFYNTYTMNCMDLYFISESYCYNNINIKNYILQICCIKNYYNILKKYIESYGAKIEWIHIHHSYKYKNIKILKYLASKSNFIFGNIIKKNNIDGPNFYLTMYCKIYTNDKFYKLINLKMFKYFIKQFNVVKQDILKFDDNYNMIQNFVYCSKDDYDMFKYVVKKFKINKYDTIHYIINLIEHCCWHNKNNLLKYIIDKFKITKRDIVTIKKNITIENYIIISNNTLKIKKNKISLLNIFKIIYNAKKLK